MNNNADLRCFSKVLATEVFQTSKIVLKFPKDENPPPVGDFGVCESESAFVDFKQTDMELNSFRESLTIHSVKFNLNDLDRYINSSVTQFVTIKADTVYMTNTLNINFNLTILARTISLPYPINVVYERNEYSLPSKFEMVQDCIQVNDHIRMRYRRYGSVILIDELKLNELEDTICKSSAMTLDNLNITQLYDLTIVNMMYLCLQALSNNGTQYEPTIDEVSDFVLKLYSNKTKIKDFWQYFNAQKFIRFKIKQDQVHQVPREPYSEFKESHKEMSEDLDEYSWNVIYQSSDLDIMKSYLQEINTEANEVEDLLLKELEDEKVYFFNLGKTMNISIFKSHDILHKW